MKNIKLLSSIIATLICGIAFGQTDINLKINHLLGTETFAFSKEATAPGNYTITLSRMEYYISKIKLVHDGGTVTPLEELYILENAGVSKTHSLGNLPITALEEIRFGVGVDNQPNVNPNDPSTNGTNHADHMLWPVSHPLGPKSPSMHWGWNSGYRFAAMHGDAGLNASFEIHALGDANYHEVSIPIAITEESGKITINLDADYLQSLDGIDVSSGLLLHSESGQAVTYLTNFRDKVFSASSMSTEIEGHDYEGVLVKVTPNPSNGQLFITLDSKDNTASKAIISDLSGSTVFESPLEQLSNEIDLQNLQSGIYLLTVISDDNAVFSEKIVLHH